MTVLAVQAGCLLFALPFCRAARAGDGAMNLTASRNTPASVPVRLAIDLTEYRALRRIRSGA